MSDASRTLLVLITAGVVLVAIAVAVHVVHVAMHALDSLGHPDTWWLE